MSRSASSRVFAIYELVQHIVRYTFVRLSSGVATECRDLVALASVNRLLSEISLSEIWMTLHSGKHLAALLPRDFNRLVSPAIAKKRHIKQLGVSVTV